MRDLMDALGGIISRIRGSTVIDEETLRGILRDLQRALIRADVDVKLVYDLTKGIEQEFKEAKELPPGLTAKDYLIYLLYRRLTDLLGGDKEPDVEIKVKPYVHPPGGYEDRQSQGQVEQVQPHPQGIAERPLRVLKQV